MGMGVNGLINAWPLQRLIQMINFAQHRNNESWKQLPVLSSLSEKNEVISNDRNEVVTWIAKVNMKFHFQYETFFLAANILDRFISSVKAQPKYLKCIAISCLYLASKVMEEEDVIPCTGELVKESECGCRVCDVLRMERIILEKLSWNINSSTALDYLYLFQILSFVHFTDIGTTISLPRHMTMLSGMMIRLLCSYEIARFSDASIALALISVELEIYTSDPAKWTSITRKLQLLAKVSTDELMTCRERLLQILPPQMTKRTVTKQVGTVKTVSLQPQIADKIEETTMKTAVLQSGSSGAIKRKAAAPSSTKQKAHSKKPHPEEFRVNKSNSNRSAEPNLEVLSESETVSDSALSRRLTYAEIVKYGQDYRAFDVASPEDDLYNTSAVTKCCSFEASCALASSLSPDANTQRRIKI